MINYYCHRVHSQVSPECPIGSDCPQADHTEAVGCLHSLLPHCIILILRLCLCLKLWISTAPCYACVCVSFHHQEIQLSSSPSGHTLQPPDGPWQSQGGGGWATKEGAHSVGK